MHPCASAAHTCGRAEVRTTLIHAEADMLSRANHAQQQQWCIVYPAAACPLRHAAMPG